MATNTNMELHTSTAISGLIYAAKQIDQALVGKPRHLNAQQAEHSGPFALTMRRLGAIAGGGDIDDLEAARSDLLFAFPFLYHLGGGFYDSMAEVLFAAHLRCADLITPVEAKALMGSYEYWLHLEAVRGHLHLLVKTPEEHDWRVYDSTYLGEPGDWYEMRYAGYEVRAVHARYEKQKEDLERWKAERQARAQESLATPPLQVLKK